MERFYRVADLQDLPQPPSGTELITHPVSRSRTGVLQTGINNRRIWRYPAALPSTFWQM